MTATTSSLVDVPEHRRVLVVSSAGKLTRYAVPPRARLVIGRGRDCDVTIDHDSVSRTHCILSDDDQLAIEDTGSRNGTFIAGRRIAARTRTPLPAGTAFAIGSAMLLVHDEALRQVRTPAPVARDPTMRAIAERLCVIAPTALPILVFGETGTGKELVAEAIHAHSERAERPLLRINCAALPATLLDSELFGSEKGAFTGATAARGGLFEAADGGTLFFDELGEMPLAMQAKLLRAIDRGEVTRIGSAQPRRVDVRVIGATHRDLRALVAAGAFREDLFYRLDGFVIRLPPLRERLAEIPDLSEQLVPDRRLSRAALSALQAHSWPGNIRELKAVLARAVVLAGDTRELRPEHLVLGAALPTVAPDRDARGRLTAADVTAALAATAGNQKAAAAYLGISRQTLIKYIERFGIGRPRKRGDGVPG